MNKLSTLGLTFEILNSKQVGNRFCNTAVTNLKTGEVTASLADCINLIEDLYKEEYRRLQDEAVGQDALLAALKARIGV
jgi:hypothetical protein